MRTEDGGCAQVSVTTEGPRIATDELARIFAPYYRSRDARAGSAEGSGLGLYIAKRIVEAHHGQIWAESLPQRATAFRFRVPGATRHLFPIGRWFCT